MSIYNLWFSSIRLTSKSKIRLLKSFKSIYDIWNYVFYDHENILIDEKTKIHMKKFWSKSKLEDICEKCSIQGIKSISFYDKDYPIKLKNISDYPAVLFYKGNIGRLNQNLNVAVVGSRNYTLYGKNSTELISRELSKNGISIISGMARGIDTFAHSGSLMENGFTCAVLGCGIDVVYPKQNKKLYDLISEKGCVISEFIPGTKPFSYNFPVRNRIISGLSDLIIVVEAGEKSGSLITAGLALDQGRDVMSVPGSIFKEQSKGTNKLIREGAYVFTDFKDIFEVLGVEYNNKVKCKKSSDILTKVEGRIYNVLSDEPMHIDDIFRRTNVDIKQLYEVLFELQLRNQVICISGNYFAKVEKTL
ncbi:DNA-processing protein DprA [Clostridium sp. JN-1]|uniref:DNA-processing protein DprA n=1 Tax=Clostridium sp. JN-1 TaxID=2483110 RepID=UPI000F0B865A|nr:DNA-processing protein DprA [Clostridium sp. JN-1]